LIPLRRQPHQVIVVMTAVVAIAVGCGASRADMFGCPDEGCDIVIKLDPDRHRLEASGTLSLPPAKEARESVVLSLRPDMAGLSAATKAKCRQRCISIAIGRSRRKWSPASAR
jgi:hypothetical protein